MCEPLGSDKFGIFSGGAIGFRVKYCSSLFLFFLRPKLVRTNFFIFGKINKKNGHISLFRIILEPFDNVFVSGFYFFIKIICNNF